MKSNLLLVDGDSQNLRILEVSLRKAGYVVFTAGSGEEALENIDETQPSLIISDTQLPGMDGFVFCKQLKCDPRWEHEPFIFLASQRSIEDKIKGLEIGVEDYLTKPIFVKEILGRIEMLLQKQQREHFALDEGESSFTGDLADMAVVDLIQTMELGRKSGIANFMNDDNRLGAIYFRNGQIIDAELGLLVGEKAVYGLLGWSQGTFEMEFQSVPRQDVIGRSNQSLLMEGMQRVDEWTRILEQFPHLETIFEVDYEQLGQRLGEVPDEMNGILRHINGQLTVMEVIENCDSGDLEALTFIHDLYQANLIYDPVAAKGSDTSRYNTRKPSGPLAKVDFQEVEAEPDTEPEPEPEPPPTLVDEEPPPTLVDEEPPPTLVDEEPPPTLVDEEPPPTQEDPEAEDEVYLLTKSPPEAPLEPREEFAAEEGRAPVDCFHMDTDTLEVPPVAEPPDSAVQTLSDQVEQGEAPQQLDEAGEETPPGADGEEPQSEEDSEKPSPQITEVDEERELEKWLAEDDESPPESSRKATLRGHVIPFPGTNIRPPASVPSEASSGTGPLPMVASEEEQTEAGQAESGEIETSQLQRISGEITSAADLAGVNDASEASINIHDEEFFASDYTGDSVEDAFDDVAMRPEDMPYSGKGKWLALSVLALGIIGGGIALYCYKTSPYVGDGPPELAVNRAGLQRKAEEMERARAAEEEAQRQAEADFASGKKRRPKTSEGAALAQADQPSPVATDEPKPATDEPKPATDEPKPATDEPPPPTATDEPKPATDKPKPTTDEPPKPAVDLEQYKSLLAQAQALQKKRRRKAAYKVFFKAGEANPAGWEALEAMALYNMEKGRMKLAYKQALQAAEANADAPYAQLVIGATLQEKGRQGGARRAYSKFVNLCPKCRFASDIRAVLRSM